MSESSLNENAITKLSSITVDMNVVAATTLFEFPPGKQGIITHVIIRPSSVGFTTLAACTDVDLGKVGATTDWANAATLAALINADLSIILKSPETWEVASPVYDAGEIFQIDIQTGAAAGSNCVLETFGFLYDE